MYNADIKQCLPKVDQANLIEKIKVWRAENKGDLFDFVLMLIQNPRRPLLTVKTVLKRVNLKTTIWKK